jgi:hypothetical protein
MHIFLTSALVEGEWSASGPGRFIHGVRAPGPHWLGDWVGARAGLSNMEKKKCLPILGLDLGPLGRPARSESLYRLHYIRGYVYNLSP